MADAQLSGDDEHELTVKLPREWGRPFLAQTRSLVSHYSFGPQLEGGMDTTDVRERYRSLADERVCVKGGGQDEGKKGDKVQGKKTEHKDKGEGGEHEDEGKKTEHKDKDEGNKSEHKDKDDGKKSEQHDEHYDKHHDKPQDDSKGSGS